MKIKDNYAICKVLAVFTFIATVTANALASILPINGMDTGQISDSFPNLFAPAGITFSIWGLIYLSLAAFTVYLVLKLDNVKPADHWLRKTGFLFTITNVANALWILAWHYKIIELSLILMLVILVSLILIVMNIRKQTLTTGEKIFVSIPFSIYFGWITVATVANVTTLLVDWSWTGFGLSEELWMILVVAVALVIGTITTLKNKDAAYGLVLIWAFAGILIKHLSPDFFDGMYTGVIVSVIASLVVFTAAVIYALVPRKKKIT